MGTISKALEKSRQAKEAADAFPIDDKTPRVIPPSESDTKQHGAGQAVGEEQLSTATMREVNLSVDNTASGNLPPLRKQPAGIEKKPPQASNGCHLGSDLISLCAPDSPESELFRILRSKVLFPREGHAPRSIMVTSAMSGEGKSFIAANLAVNIAKNIDQHVLLIDCDLREPSVHRKFGFDGCKGLSEYLANGTALPQLLLKTSVDKLTLLPAGTPPENPAEILSSAKMDALMVELLARYDDRYIIIDAPPPVVVPDTGALIKKVDGILLVIQYGKTDFDLIEELVEQVGREKIIGAVINRSTSRSSRRYAYNRYRKYGKYSRGA